MLLNLPIMLFGNASIFPLLCFKFSLLCQVVAVFCMILNVYQIKLKIIHNVADLYMSCPFEWKAKGI